MSKNPTVTDHSGAFVVLRELLELSCLEKGLVASLLLLVVRELQCIKLRG